MVNYIKQDSINVDVEKWEKAKEIFKKSGMNINDAINIFLDKVQKVGGLPFEIDEPSKEKILEGLKEAVEEVKLYKEGKIKLKTLDEVLSEL